MQRQHLLIFLIFLESINSNEIANEASAINYAFISKILHNFTEEENLLPTVCGRMSSSPFDFTINSENESFKINVKNSQIEIDGGFEGHYSLSLIEAKNYISDNFLIRQLYYPYTLTDYGSIKSASAFVRSFLHIQMVFFI